jgi:hypothetical protein
MTKKTIGLSIDEDILQKAKDTIPNLSEFFEECLKHYFGYADGTFPIGNINDITDKIGKLQVELFLINQNYDMKTAMKEAENFEKDKAWRFLWNDYRIRLIPDEMLMTNAVKELGIDEDTLEDLLDEVYEAMKNSEDFIDTDEWQNVIDWYNKVVK